MNRVIAIQLGMGNLVYQSSTVEEGAIQVVREALQHLWHSFASLSVNLNTELAQVLLEDLECLAQEQARARELPQMLTKRQSAQNEGKTR